MNVGKYDKIVHFVCGFCLSALGFIIPPLFMLGFVAGIVKELLDTKKDKPFDVVDMLATFAGASVAVASAYL